MAAEPCLLVVEDDVALRKLLVAALSRAGYTVLGAGSALEADALLRDERRVPELLLADVGLPGEDGISFARRLRAAHPGLHVVLVSGSGIELRGLPADTIVLPKPFSPATLLVYIRTALHPGAARVAV